MTRSTPVRPEAAFRVVPASGLVRQRWHNDAGWTREIHRARSASVPGAPEQDWDWRLSIAEVESPDAFSTFPGVERETVLLHGNGLALRIDDEDEACLQPPHGRIRYRGESAVVGRPIDGAVEVFNLMWRRDAVQTRMWHRPLVGPMVVFVDPGSHWAVYLIAGSADVSGEGGLAKLAAGDTALLSAVGTRGRFLVEGGGEVLLVRVDPYGPDSAAPIEASTTP